MAEMYGTSFKEQRLGYDLPVREMFGTNNKWKGRTPLHLIGHREHTSPPSHMSMSQRLLSHLPRVNYIRWPSLPSPNLQRMSSMVRASQRYLTPLDLWDEIKPYEITGRVPPGLARTNLDLTPYEVDIHDARAKAVHDVLIGGGEDNSTRRLFEKTGFTWVRHTTDEGLDSDASIDSHLEDMTEFLSNYFQADIVRIFQYQIRKRIPDPQDPRVRPPSNFVHVDLSRVGAEARIRFSFPDEAETILQGGRYRMLSVWRPLFSPLKDSPMAVCDSRSVVDEDLLESDYIYPTFVSESLVVKHSLKHKWYYLSEQTRHEILILTNYDSGSQIRVPHSAFELPATEEAVRPRESIEIKAVVWTRKA